MDTGVKESTQEKIVAHPLGILEYRFHEGEIQSRGIDQNVPGIRKGWMRSSYSELRKGMVEEMESLAELDPRYKLLYDLIQAKIAWNKEHENG